VPVRDATFARGFFTVICDNSGHTIISFRLDGEYCTALGECSQKNEDMRIIDG
jgi:hypothetical protein